MKTMHAIVKYDEQYQIIYTVQIIYIVKVEVCLSH